MVQVVGILGFKGSGKDTAGEYLVREHGFVVESFANPLKDLLAAVFGWDRALLEGDTTDSRTWREIPDEWWEAKLNWAENKGAYLGRFTPRVAMQVIGTDVLRGHFDDNLWIKSLEARLRGHERVVITDCRFPNECSLVRDHGGLLFQVHRGPQPEWLPFARAAAASPPNSTARRLMVDSFPKAHVSEWAWVAEETAVIANDGSLSDLYDKTRCLLTTHFSSH